MFYGYIRLVLAGVVLLPLIASTRIREKFRGKLGLYLAAICTSILLLSVLLYQWPLENYFGGFKSIEQALNYKYGSCDLQYSIENEGSVFVSSNKTNEILHKTADRYCFISPIYTYRKDAFASKVDVVIYGDKRTPERFVQVAIWEENWIPETIADNKGTQYHEGFSLDETTYYFGSFRDDGSAFSLLIDGISVDLVDLN